MSTEAKTAAAADEQGGHDSLTITDNRTGRSYEVPVVDGAVRSLDLRQIKTSEDDFGLLAYDPAFMNTASCRSAITFLDGDAGVLEYRGYPIEQLAEKSTYLEVAYLLVHGELPTAKQLEEWTHLITIHTFVHENVKSFMQGFRHDAHPMGMLLGAIGALSTFYPDANRIHDAENRAIQTIRLIAKMPTLAAFSYRHNMGMPYVYPDNDLNYAGNLLGMLYKMTELKYQPDPRASSGRSTCSSSSTPTTSRTARPARCGASAHRWSTPTRRSPAASPRSTAPSTAAPTRRSCGCSTASRAPTNIPSFIEGVKAGQERLMGFGHRVYKNYDPRARIIKKACDDVFEVTGTNPLLAIATELEKIALEDEYFVSRKLYPNVDFYSGLIYEALGMPMSMFPVMFAIGRTSGWVAQWLEMVQDSEQKIARPRQIYTGQRERDYVALADRG